MRRGWCRVLRLVRGSHVFDEAEAGRGDHRDEVVLDAARGHVAQLWKRKDTGEPLTPEFVQGLCVWSQRLMWAEKNSGNGDDLAGVKARHMRRMRDLHAELKKRFDEDRDVSRIQVSQAAYVLREAEL